MRVTILLMAVLWSVITLAQDPTGYQVPPKAIADLVKAPSTPGVSVNAQGEWMAFFDRPGYPGIVELAQPELRLAGLRINPRTNGSSRSYSFTGISLKRVEEGEPIPVKGIPDNARIQNIRWSPDGQKIAFTNEVNSGIQLWMVDVEAGEAMQLTEEIVNDAIGSPYVWMPDSDHMLLKAVVTDRGNAPDAPLAPAGPVIQETAGSKAPVRTFQDLLQNPHDEALFTYYTSSQLQLLGLSDKTFTPFGEAGIISSVEPSPDGKYVMVNYVEQPFSYIVPYYRFAQRVVMYDAQGNEVQVIAEIPKSENIPKGFGAVRTGPRGFEWREDQPSTLTWVEAQDGGDPAAETEFRDRLFQLAAPFDGEAQPSIPFKLRFGGVTWGNDDLAIAYEYWWSTRELITSRFAPDDKDSKEVLFERSFEDRYNDPGSFVTVQKENGADVLLTDKKGRTLYLTGQGASPEGNRPFLRSFSLRDKSTKELWRSQTPFYESPVQVLDVNNGLLITRRESPENPPNYFLRDVKANQLTALTDFAHPYPALQGIEKQTIYYKRDDGIQLKGDLYLPKGYDPEEDGALPVLMWAYPDEFKSAAAASQVQGSPYEFTRLGWYSPLYFVTQGYAIFDDISMPIVGEGEEEPNDNFRDQLVANLAAAIDTLDEMGIGDPDRVAIGGHSYGAFMTANLLAHSDLLAAGIARSGAYNRTLTPFGFQSEERTYWDAPEVYYDMSPFMHAEKINEPLLLIHGEADNNSGTFPMQSERLYAAIKGLGGTARLVMLPHESHSYRAEESILHMLWEMDEFLNKHVKSK